MQRQSQVALSLLLVCIVLEIVGRPFREASEDHSILKHLELGSLFVEWGTLWCGLMIYQSGPRSEGINIFMTFAVISANVVLMSYFLLVLARAVIEENKESAVVKRVLSFRKKSSSADQMEQAISSSQTANSGTEETGLELTEQKENPLYKRRSPRLGQAASVAVATGRWKKGLRAAELDPERVNSQDMPRRPKPSLKKASDYVRTTGSVIKKMKRRRRYSKEVTADGDVYFVPEDGGDSVWELPDGAKVINL